MKLLVVLSLMALGSTARSATLAGPEYPPPGGVTFAPSGAGSGIGLGKTFSYSNFDATKYGQLYWGPVSILNVNNVGETPATNMAFAGLVGEFYEFDSTAAWSYDSIQTGLVQLPTKFLLSVIGLGTENTEASLGATTNPSYPLFQVTGNYSATFVFQVFYNSAWTPVRDFQNAHNNLGNTQVQTSVNFAFFNTDAAPEPGTWAMFGIGVALLGVLGHRGSLTKT